jgi:hypothetical protein
MQVANRQAVDIGHVSRGLEHWWVFWGGGPWRGVVVAYMVKGAGDAQQPVPFVKRQRLRSWARSLHHASSRRCVCKGGGMS